MEHFLGHEQSLNTQSNLSTPQPNEARMDGKPGPEVTEDISHDTPAIPSYFAARVIVPLSRLASALRYV